MPPKRTTEEFIKLANQTHNGKYNYSKTYYKSALENVIITCNLHGDFIQQANSHKRGAGCPTCGKEKAIKNKTRTTLDFINDAVSKHGNKYDYTKSIYTGVTEELDIICKLHGSFKQTPHKHINHGHGCHKCGIEKCGKGRLYTTETFVEKAILKHGELYDYTMTTYIKSDVHVIITCKIHGEFKQVPEYHLSGNGCPQCGGSIKRTTQEFINDAQKIHGNTYDYSHSEYINARTKVKIKCSIHGLFEQTPAGHLHCKSGQCCPKCRMCPSCMLWHTNSKLCSYCKPKNQNKLYFKTKEMKVVQYLRDNLPDEHFIHNKSVGSACTGGHLFPDILFECLCYNIIVEIDEFKHRGASYACDEQRMYDIIAKLGTPCIFIRYNPDHKDSNMEDLLETVKEYLMFQYNEDLLEENAKYEYAWNQFGFDCHYMFYY